MCTYHSSFFLDILIILADPSSDFWEELKSLLNSQMNKVHISYFSLTLLQEDADKVFQQFKESHKIYVNSLSLDDTDRLAIQLFQLEKKNT